jgi:hypothetical protein
VVVRVSAGSLTAATCLLLLAACTGGSEVDSRESPSIAEPNIAEPSTAAPTPSPMPSESPTPRPVRFSGSNAMADVRTLAGQIGPRLATGPAFREAGRRVAARFTELGYDVRHQSFHVPAGDSWGVPVQAGRSFNVVATPPGFNASKPHRIVGAHLDTVAVAPGAEDNASGVAVVLELARLAAEAETTLPTVFIAFGGEEPRGPGDDMHHFGSMQYVREMSRAQRRGLQAMVSLDRVGVGARVPVCTGGVSPRRVQNDLRTVGRLMDIPTQACDSTASDHWSFEKAGFAVARLGSTPYAGYHSATDLPRVVNTRQLARTGRLTWGWLTQSSAGE